ncbi:MAG: hypothetical protein ACOYLX_23180 [Burkholderiaceae bacterium]
MSRSWGSILLLCLVGAVLAGPAYARGGADDDPDRQARRMELRRQLEAERERWRAEPGEMRRQRQGFVAPPGASEAAPRSYGPMHPAAPAQGAPGPGAPRLTPEERRALRQELRQQWP